MAMLKLNARSNKRLRLTSSAVASKMTGDAWRKPSSLSAAKSDWHAWPAVANAIFRHPLHAEMAALKLITSSPFGSK
eukprot:11229370-Karenia_brevis.AAC.1